MSREWSYVGEAKALRETRAPLNDHEIEWAYLADADAREALQLLTETPPENATVTDCKAALRALARAIERAHGIGGEA